ncbi:hypothetical protein CW354_00640 [Marinicaulis flavus]|uniref:Uncharacterized protein n=1 Tax=Hyphococcus luteus TaxID=2058213 RepID=A0A2S7KA75_9PROT|nr:hypothetical protein CW354_00640 [Marinicaulis flavus]
MRPVFRSGFLFFPGTAPAAPRADLKRMADRRAGSSGPFRASIEIALWLLTHFRGKSCIFKRITLA